MKETSSDLSSYSDKYKDKPKVVAFLFAGLFLILILLIGLYVLGATSKRSSSLSLPTLTPTPQQTVVTITPQPTAPAKTTKKGTPTPTTKPTATPTPTKTPAKSNRGDLSIAVLNGSGVSGAAKSISSYLSNLGYTVKTVGNASRFDYTDLTIVISKKKSTYLDQLKKDLTGKAGNITTSISDDVSADAEVIVGK